jgi:hypothetical protein
MERGQLAGMHPSALQAAAAAGDTNAVHAMLEAMDASTRTHRWRAFFGLAPTAEGTRASCTLALAAACREGHAEVVRLLLAHGAGTPSMEDAVIGHSTAVVDCLLHDGRADPNPGLVLAARSGNRAMVDLLLSDARTTDVPAALFKATKHCHAHIVFALAIDARAAQTLPVLITALEQTLRSGGMFGISPQAMEFMPQFNAHVRRVYDARVRILDLLRRTRRFRRRFLWMAAAGSKGVWRHEGFRFPPPL